VDTRSSTEGVIGANTSRIFRVSGAAGTLSSQGGSATGCVDPRASSGLEPVAVSAYIVAVPTVTSTGGLLTAFPSDQADPGAAIATVNFAAGQVVGNTTTMTLCKRSDCPAGGPLAVIAHNTEQHVVIDVQGYFYSVTESCPGDMVATGSLCIDKYEASIWDAKTGGAQFNPVGNPAAMLPCGAGGSDCGMGSVNAVYARSEKGVMPARTVSWYQALQACANAGKRLPTMAEWRQAAAGTASQTCNRGGTVLPSGSMPGCVSTAGAVDMVGNVMEWSADLGIKATTGVLSAADMRARALGGSHNSSAAATGTVFVPGAGPLATDTQIGFRCVR